jgi:NTE family protein
MRETERSRLGAPAKLVTAVVLSGGLALASYHAGVIQTLARRRVTVDWLAGSSSGAVTAAIVGGGDLGSAVDRLAEFWGISRDFQQLPEDPWAHLRGWFDVARNHVLGNGRHFIPRLPTMTGFKSLYDLAEMRRRLSSLIDFGRLNSGSMRITVAATDLASGDPVLFDTTTGLIGIDHIMASCGFLPEFAPVEIGGRALVDGGLSLNAPFEPILDADHPLDLYVVDLFARDGAIPKSLERAAERKTDLMFGNQTFLRLKPQLALRGLRRGEEAEEDRVSYLSYRAGATEPGSEKSFNFSPDELARRWRAGSLDMQAALDSQGFGLRIIRRGPD